VQTRNKITVPHLPGRIEAPSSVDLALLERQVKDLQKVYQELVTRINSYTQGVADAIKVVTRIAQRQDEIESQIGQLNTVIAGLEKPGGIRAKEEEDTRRRKRKP